MFSSRSLRFVAASFAAVALSCSGGGSGDDSSSATVEPVDDPATESEGCRSRPPDADTFGVGTELSESPDEAGDNLQLVVTNNSEAAVDIVWDSAGAPLLPVSATQILGTALSNLHTDSATLQPGASETIAVIVGHQTCGDGADEYAVEFVVDGAAVMSSPIPASDVDGLI